MAIALHPSNPGFIYSGAPYRRRSHLHLVVTEPVNNHPTPNAMTLIYRRRRLTAAFAVLLLLAVSIFSLVAVFGGPAKATEFTSGQGSTPHVVIAQPGDTLWAIARRIVPVGSITELVDQLVVMNGDEIVAGQEVRLP